MNDGNELYIGLMSGTSIDGVDAVVAYIDVNSTTLVTSYEHPVPDQLRQRILELCSNGCTSVAEIGLLDHELGKLYATVVNELLEQAQLHASQITAIGNHGQTVFHQPAGESPFTMQLGDANLIAARTGINTVADFRRIDMALGGQGAPLVPAFHRYLFEPRESTTVVLNIGGIANITVLQFDGGVVGFDTGPGNILMDGWCETHTGKPYDQNAEWARQGQVNTELLQQLLTDPFLDLPSPKSTGREHYNQKWLRQQLESLATVTVISPQDVQRTLCEFTAKSISQQVEVFRQGQRCELLLCGGGANNPLLTELIKQHLPDWQVLQTSDRGVPGDFMEALAFAWLARQRVHNRPSNLPLVTGAAREVSLGVFYPAAGSLTKEVW